jgi:hypothetical protein
MNEVTSSEERGWAMAAHLCGLLPPYRYPFSLRLVK